MSVRFTYHGGMTVLIERSDGFKILCDPFFTQNESAVISPEEMYDVDLILVTHAAFDHYGDTAQIMKNSRASIIAGGEVLRMLEREIGELPPERKHFTIYGDELVFGNTVVRTTQAWHCSNTIQGQERIMASSFPFSYIVHVEDNTTYYHAGDTSLFSDMKLIREMYKPNVMTVGISRISAEYACELTPREAAYATSWIGPDVVIPTHYASGSKDLSTFLTCMEVLAPKTIVKSQVGIPFTYTPFCVM